MPLYEVMFIVQPDLEGDELEAAISRVGDVMEKEGGEIVSLKKMGKKKLAYEINDIKEGSYVLINVQAGGGMVPALDHFFKVNEGYLRYIIIRLEERKKVEPQQVAQEAAEEVQVTEEVQAAEEVQVAEEVQENKDVQKDQDDSKEE